MEKPQIRSVAETADHVLRGNDVHANIMIGPVVRSPHDHGLTWYWIICSADDGVVRFDQVRSPERALAEQSRAALIVELIQRRPIVVHTFDDELAMLRLCDPLWSSEKTRSIRADIEAERGTVQVSRRAVAP